MPVDTPHGSFSRRYLWVFWSIIDAFQTIAILKFANEIPFHCVWFGQITGKHTSFEKICSVVRFWTTKKSIAYSIRFLLFLMPISGNKSMFVFIPFLNMARYCSFYQQHLFRDYIISWNVAEIEHTIGIFGCHVMKMTRRHAMSNRICLTFSLSSLTVPERYFFLRSWQPTKNIWSAYQCQIQIFKSICSWICLHVSQVFFLIFYQ